MAHSRKGRTGEYSERTKSQLPHRRLEPPRQKSAQQQQQQNERRTPLDELVTWMPSWGSIRFGHRRTLNDTRTKPNDQMRIPFRVANGGQPTIIHADEILPEHQHHQTAVVIKKN
jgi:hypothetical protein